MNEFVKVFDDTFKAIKCYNYPNGSVVIFD